jgi:SNF2 family DNA or RNA helicase
MELYPYQVEDVKALSERPRCILGSEMGIGKTAEVLALVKQEDMASVLVICPKSLISEWEYQVEQWLGKEWLDRFVILNYEKLRKDTVLAAIIQYKWDLICFDECHKLKNPKALQTKGATLVSNDGARVIMMSGTPMMAGPQDLFSLLRIINPITYKSYSDFIQRYCVIIQLPKPPFPNIIVGPRKDTQEELSNILSQYMIRRLKKDVLDLPPKLYRTIPVELEPSQRAKYNQMEDELFVLLDSGEKITAPAITAQITRLRQICLEPNLLSQIEKVSSPSTKTLLLLDLIEGTKSPVVVYTVFEKYTRILSEELTKHKVPHALFTGATSMPDRTQALRDFQQGKYKVLVGTITTMGLGVTLTASHTVIFTDNYWTPAVNEQAVDRLHRIGQNETVDILDMWAKGTIEDHVHRVLNRKEKPINEIMLRAKVLESLRQERRTQL